MARNKKEREEWRKKPALKPPQGVPHPPVHHYSHSSVSLIFHFQVLIYIALTGAIIINNHAYILQWFTLYHHCNSDAPHISCLKVKSCNSQHYHGAFLHHLQQHGCSSVTNHICNIQVPQLTLIHIFFFTQLPLSRMTSNPWLQICVNNSETKFTAWIFFYLEVFFCFCLSVSFTIDNSMFHNS